MQFLTFIASDYFNPDSNVRTGGGTDLTKEVQKILDMAGDDLGVRLIMDGAALVSSLELSSNTIIECPTKDCGFYQKDDSDCALVTNKIWDARKLGTRNISLIGGTYNQNCLHQQHDVENFKKRLYTPADGDEEYSQGEGISFSKNNAAKRHWTYGFEFYGVENLVIRDLSIVDFRTFSVTIGGFKNVLIENVWLELPNRLHAQNQDGLHFWGPGSFLTVKNVGGQVGDDFMNIGPDESDGVSSITDVIVDGVYLDDADQAIRLLSHGSGTLDRVTIRNMSGTYRSFGFYINCWFPGATYGDFKNIFFENIDLRQTTPNYNYRPPMLFSIGGNIECLTFKNIRHHKPSDNRALFEFGYPFYDLKFEFPTDNMPKMQNFIIDGLTIIEDGDSAKNANYIEIHHPMDNLLIKNVYVVKDNTEPSGHLVAFKNKGELKRLFMNDVIASGFDSLIDDTSKIAFLHQNNVNEF